ncbi:MAG: aldo/keto reductase [Fibrobacter sp.]|nr:aldo/keto reductase [Fibrobacter sp.]
MQKMRLGRTGLIVSRSGFGALPIQRISLDEASILLKKAFSGGITFFDTARSYSDSEEKIGYALSDVRSSIVIATKSPAKNKTELLSDLQISLQKLKTEYVDILQLHNPDELPDPSDPQSSYAGLLEAQKRGMTRFVGLTNHKLPLAREAALSGKYDTIQFPLNTLSTEEELDLIEDCKKSDCGLIAMKALSGGLIRNVRTVFAFLRQYDNVLPIWGIQRGSELEEFLELEKNPVMMSDIIREEIAIDRTELAGRFCRGCGYCMPCPLDIQICWVARMSLLLRRAPAQNFMNSYWNEKMMAIKNCTGCGQCRSKCPYSLDTPALLRDNLADYEQFQSLYDRQ